MRAVAWSKPPPDQAHGLTGAESPIGDAPFGALVADKALPVHWSLEGGEGGDSMSADHGERRVRDAVMCELRGRIEIFSARIKECGAVAI